MKIIVLFFLIVLSISGKLYSNDSYEYFNIKNKQKFIEHIISLVIAEERGYRPSDIEDLGDSYYKDQFMKNTYSWFTTWYSRINREYREAMEEQLRSQLNIIKHDTIQKIRDHNANDELQIISDEDQLYRNVEKIIIYELIYKSEVYKTSYMPYLVGFALGLGYSICASTIYNLSFNS